MTKECRCAPEEMVPGYPEPLCDACQEAEEAYCAAEPYPDSEAGARALVAAEIDLEELGLEGVPFTVRPDPVVAGVWLAQWDTPERTAAVLYLPTGDFEMGELCR